MDFIFMKYYILLSHRRIKIFLTVTNVTLSAKVDRVLGLKKFEVSMTVIDVII